MKLSEAIRLGSMLHPQGFGALQTSQGTCAFGAAYEAIGHKLDVNQDGVCSHTYYHEPEWRWVEKGRWKDIACPACHCLGSVASRISAHLNDQHHWTRGQIADWLEGIEQEYEQSLIERAAEVEASQYLTSEATLVETEVA